MKLNEILEAINSRGWDRQPTPWDEHLYIFWNVGWLDVAYGIDCKRWSFTEKDGEVEKIYVTIYDSKWGGPQTTFKEIKDIHDIYFYID